MNKRNLKPVAPKRYIRFNVSIKLHKELQKAAKMAEKGFSEWIRETLKREVKIVTGIKPKG